jgi:AcrR family transcriptional regulator
MHDLMEGAEVPGGSMYHYFPTKKGLALAVIAERVMPAVRETWIEPVRSASDAREGILSVFEDVAASVERKNGKAVGCPVSNLAVELALVDRDFQKALSGVYEAWRIAVLERIGNDALATAIVASFSGAMSLAKTHQSARPIHECAEVIERLLKAA